MLNPFPIQFLSLLAYTTLRIIVGLVLMRLGVKHLRHRVELAGSFSRIHLPLGSFFAWYVAFFEVLVGTLFVLGLATQVAALLAGLLSLKFMYLGPKLQTPLIPERIFWIIIFGTSISLLITGAGAFAFDLPI